MSSPPLLTASCRSWLAFVLTIAALGLTARDVSAAGCARHDAKGLEYGRAWEPISLLSFDLGPVPLATALTTPPCDGPPAAPTDGARPAIPYDSAILVDGPIALPDTGSAIPPGPSDEPPPAISRRLDRPPRAV